MDEGSATGRVVSLRCRECGRKYPPLRTYACDRCFGPLDVVYDYDSINLSRTSFTNRPGTLWRYLDLLPIEDERKIVDLSAGFTPLLKAERLGKVLGLKNLYIKNDTVNPTYSFKDRPACVAVSKALEFGVNAVGCASTGNLAAATAAHAAKADLPCYIFIPFDIEMNKVAQASAYGAHLIAVRGTYDDANRLAAMAGEAYGWALVNISIRPYYVEGSKTLAFEVCEQLGWKTPDHVIVPVGSGALLCAIYRGFKEFEKVGLIDDGKVKMTGAQGRGCAPVVDAFKAGRDEIIPVERPDTIAKSLAVGDPGDGYYALKIIRESGGFAEEANDGEIVSAIRLLAETEGIFTEPAGSVTIATLQKLLKEGSIDPEETIVCYVTGNGLKTTEAIIKSIPSPTIVEPRLEALSIIK